MDILSLLTGTAVILFILVTLALAIGPAGDGSGDRGLASLAPLAPSRSTDRRRTVPEPEPTPWRLRMLTPQAGAA